MRDERSRKKPAREKSARVPFLLLDLDNTVYPYQPCHRAGLEAAARAASALDPAWADPAAFRAGYDRARRLVKERAGKRSAAAHCRLLYLKAMLEQQRGKSELAAARRLHDRYWKGYFAAMRPDSGCATLLAELRRAGTRIAWVSNFTTERQMRKLTALGLARAAEFLFTSEEAGAEKPDPAVFRLALAALDADPARTWMVGDDLADDVAPARALGLTTVWLRRAGDGPLAASHEGPLPHHVARDWADLRALLL